MPCAARPMILVLLSPNPSANLAVMGGVQAAKVLLQIETATLKRKGETLSPEREQELLVNIQKKYDEQTSPYYAVSPSLGGCNHRPLGYSTMDIYGN